MADAVAPHQQARDRIDEQFADRELFDRKACRSVPVQGIGVSYWAVNENAPG